MCLSNDIPKAPPPPPPPPPTPIFQPGSELDMDSLDISGGAKKGKDSLKTSRNESGLGIPIV
jgi:hypothetical protein